MTKQKKLPAQFFSFEWLRDNAFILLWLTVVFSALFNVGYFITVDIKYLGLLSISDYYAGTMVYLGIMILLINGLCSFLFTKRNMYLQPWIALIRGCGILMRVFRVKTRLNKHSRILDKIPTNKLSKNDLKRWRNEQKYNQLAKNEVNSIKQHTHKDIIFSFFWGVLTLGLFSTMLYGIYTFVGLSVTLILFGVFLFFYVIDYFVSKPELMRIFFVYGTVMIVPLLGYGMLVHNMKNQQAQVCSTEECYYLVRKIENGYFVIKDNKFVFLDNEFAIKIIKGMIPQFQKKQKV